MNSCYSRLCIIFFNCIIFGSTFVMCCLKQLLFLRSIFITSSNTCIIKFSSLKAVNLNLRSTSILNLISISELAESWQSVQCATFQTSMAVRVYRNIASKKRICDFCRFLVVFAQPSASVGQQFISVRLIAIQPSRISKVDQVVLLRVGQMSLKSLKSLLEGPVVFPNTVVPTRHSRSSRTW